MLCHAHLYYSCMIYWLNFLQPPDIYFICISKIRTKIPPSILSSSAEESKTSRPILKSSKLRTESQENIDGKKFQKILQTKQTQPARLSRGSSNNSHRVVPKSCLRTRSSQVHDENDSDSSFEDSQIIEDLFFVK